jgi:hypothetical protein
MYIYIYIYISLYSFNGLQKKRKAVLAKKIEVQEKLPKSAQKSSKAHGPSKENLDKDNDLYQGRLLEG